MNLGRTKVGRRATQDEDFETGNGQDSASIEKAFPYIGDLIPEETGPDEPPTNQLVGSLPLHPQTSYASESQATVSSIVSTERQHSLRERAECMRGGISALEELLNENVPEEQRRAAQVELQQLRSAMAMLSSMEQSDWARGVVDEPPPAYNTLLGR